MALACDPQSLLNAAACIDRCIPKGMQGAVLISVMCQLVNNISGGGSNCLLCGFVDPTSTPPCDCALYFRPDTNEMWFWDSATSAWNKVIST